MSNSKVAQDFLQSIPISKKHTRNFSIFVHRILNSTSPSLPVPSFFKEIVRKKNQHMPQRNVGQVLTHLSDSTELIPYPPRCPPKKLQVRSKLYFIYLLVTLTSCSRLWWRFSHETSNVALDSNAQLKQHKEKQNTCLYNPCGVWPTPNCLKTPHFGQNIHCSLLVRTIVKQVAYLQELTCMWLLARTLRWMFWQKICP